MFAFDNLNNNEQNINLNPIYQHLNSLDGDVIRIDGDVNSIINDLMVIDGHINSIEGDISSINNHLVEVDSDISNIKTDITNIEYTVNKLTKDDMWLFGPGARFWTQNVPTDSLNGFLYALYTNNGYGLVTSLNYNYRADYDTVAFDSVVNVALNNDNKFKNKIELTGNLKFSNIDFTNNDIRTIILKNKCNNIFNSCAFKNLTANKLICVDGYSSIYDLSLSNIKGDIKIKNINDLHNISCVSLKNVTLKNIDKISMYNKTLSFTEINNLYINNVLIDIHNDFYFSGITNLIVDNATFSGKNTNNHMFGSIKKACFNNVNFNLLPLETTNVDIFHNQSGSFNDFNFDNCTFSLEHDAYFAGIHGLINNCKFDILNFKTHNNISLNVGGFGGISNKLFYLVASNSININDFYGYDYVFNVNGNDNVINYEHEEGAVNVSLTIDEIKTGIDNVYSFKNNNSVKVDIIYGNTTGTASTKNNNPTIYLDKYCNLKISHSDPYLKMSHNTFDIYFNDSFNCDNKSQFNVNYFAKGNGWEFMLESSDLTKIDFNTFNLHFNNNNYVNRTTDIKPIYYPSVKTKGINIEITTIPVLTDVEINDYVVNPKFYNIFAYYFFSKPTESSFTTKPNWSESYATFTKFFTKSVLPNRVNFFDANGHKLNLML